MRSSATRLPLLFWLLALLLAAFLFSPVAYLFWLLGWARLTSSWQHPLTYAALRVSLETSTVATVLMALLGIPLGYLLAREHFPGRALVMALVFFPLVLPPLVGGILLLALYGPYGAVGHWLARWQLALVSNPAAIVVAQMFVASPYVIVTAHSSFQAVDPELEQVAATLGDSRWQIFRRVALPLAWPGLVAGLALAWMRSLGEFGATLVVAYTPHSLPIWLWAELTSEGLQAALPLAFLLVLLGLAALLVVRMLGQLPAVRTRPLRRGIERP